MHQTGLRSQYFFTGCMAAPRVPGFALAVLVRRHVQMLKFRRLSVGACDFFGMSLPRENFPMTGRARLS